jgi:hypothetical protein
MAAALVLGGHFALTTTPSASADASEGAQPMDASPEAPATEADDQAVEATTTPAASAAGTEAAPRVTTAPARVRMTPGPAFAGSMPLQPGADTAVPANAPLASMTPGRAGAAAADPIIAPAPVKPEMALPDLSTDSVVPRRASDTMAMKKILRALNGSKPPETPAAP